MQSIKVFEISSGKVDADANSDTFTSRFVIAADTGTVDNPNGDITADNIYAGAAGLQTELVSFLYTTYPNNSTYTITLRQHKHRLAQELWEFG